MNVRIDTLEKKLDALKEITHDNEILVKLAVQKQTSDFEKLDVIINQIHKKIDAINLEIISNTSINQKNILDINKKLDSLCRDAQARSSFLDAVHKWHRVILGIGGVVGVALGIWLKQSQPIAFSEQHEMHHKSISAEQKYRV